MPIDNIQRMAELGVFRDFRWPVDLPHFTKYNLIYGWNGSGKTTISRLFRNLEAKHNPDEGSAVVTIDGVTFRSDNFQNANVVIKVFNHEFVTANVHRSDGGNIPPIFVLGETTARQQQELRDKQRRRQLVTEQLTESERILSNAQRDFDRHTRTTARLIKDRLRSNAYPNYNNYDKNDYIARIDSMLQSENPSELILDESQVIAKSEQFTSTHLDTIDLIRMPNMSLTTHNRTVEDLLQQTVVSNTIDSLQNDPDLAAWTRLGLNLHEERNTDTCLFCGQSLPQDCLTKLHAHFNDAYEQLIDALNSEIRDLHRLVSNLDAVELPDANRLYPNVRQRYQLVRQDLEAAINRISELIALTVTELQSKTENMFRPVNRQCAVITFNQDAISAVNDVIRNHNAISESYIQQVGQSAEALESHWVANQSTTYSDLKSAVSEATARQTNLSSELSELDTTIPRLQSELRDHRRPAEQFNRELSSYLGHEELQLRPEQTGYKIVRGGRPAYRISEGEQTAIALIYFLKSLENVDHGVSDCIVVLDDPISSLDSNALYAAYGLIRERCKDAKQLFLLTHNFVFFREFRDWFNVDNRYTDANEELPATFYMLKQHFDDYGRKSEISQLDPLLRDFESDYHYLFWYVFKTAQNTEERDLQEFYPLPNITRRLLETFLAFKFPHLNQGVGASLDAAQIEPHVRRRIMRYVDSYSHGNAINEPGHDHSLLAQTPNILNSVIDVMNQIDRDHVRRMKKLVTRQHAPSD